MRTLAASLQHLVQDPSKPLSLLRWTLSHPGGSYRLLSGWNHMRFARRGRDWRTEAYPPDRHWREHLGVTSQDRSRTSALWPVVNETLEQQGLRPGPESYFQWNDGDPALIDALWCLVRILSANKVVETGVAHGVTSRFILEALAATDGRLWSVDLPPASSPARQAEIGAAVSDRSRWALLLGASQDLLPSLLKEVGPIDLFIHDSDHSTINMMFEMSLAWEALRPGGALVVDDIDLNWGFDAFRRQVRCNYVVAEAEPLRPDLRRFNGKGSFGVLFKPG